MLNTIGGGGWKLVRHVPKGNKWHPATDLLAGTQAYGDPKNMDKAWSDKFDNSKFNEFLFATGDMSLWMTMEKDEATGSFYSAKKRQILSSSFSCAPSQATMYRRSGNKEDPWISLKDHSTSIKEGSIVYGENGFGGKHSESISKHDGGDVYIRMTM
jgi:glutathionyl-hydroquinone reductase